MFVFSYLLSEAFNTDSCYLPTEKIKIILDYLLMENSVFYYLFLLSYFTPSSSLLICINKEIRFKIQIYYANRKFEDDRIVSLCHPKK